jgi:hypothetical protein
VTRDTKKLSERASSAATRREELDRTMTAILAAIADCFPTLKAKSNPKYFIDRIIKAERQAEWNQAMAKSVTWGLQHAIPLQELSGADPKNGELRWRFLLGRLEDALAHGFLPNAGRPAETLNLEHDAAILLGNGVRIRSREDGKKSSIEQKFESKMTIPEAARILMLWDRASLISDRLLKQEWDPTDTDKKHFDRARKRVLNVNRTFDLDLARGEPYGRPKSGTR